MATKTELGAKFKSGDKSPMTGNYVCEDCEKAGTRHEVKVQEGASFPKCDNEDATWRLESYETMS